MRRSTLLFIGAGLVFLAGVFAPNPKTEILSVIFFGLIGFGLHQRDKEDDIRRREEIRQFDLELEAEERESQRGQS